MGIDFTVDAAVDRVRRKLQLREDNAKLSETEIIQIMDEEIQDNLFPALIECVEDYGVQWGPVTVPAGYFQARLPPWASSATIMSVRYVMPTTSREVEVAHLPIGQLPTQNVSANQGSAGPQFYALDSGSICVFPQPQSTAITLRVLYQRRPSRLVPVSACIPATSMATYGTVSYSGAAVLVADQNVDAVAGSPPLGVYESYLYINTIGPGSLTLLSRDPANGTTPHNLTGFAAVTAAGGSAYSLSNDYVTPAGFTCVFPLPEAWYPAWITASAATVAEEIGDMTKAAMLREKSNATIAKLQAHQANRARDQPLPVFNRDSPARRARRWGSGCFGGSNP